MLMLLLLLHAVHRLLLPVKVHLLQRVVMNLLLSLLRMRLKPLDMLDVLLLVLEILLLVLLLVLLVLVSGRIMKVGHVSRFGRFIRT